MRRALPEFVPPQLATLVGEAPEGDAWLHEMKYDGYRLMLRIAEDVVTLHTRNGNDWTSGMPAIERAARSLSTKAAIFDGELVALRADGVSDFQLLQGALSAEKERSLVYFVFDVLFLDGKDVRDKPLEERKKILKRALAGADEKIRYSDHVVGEGPAFFQQACKLGLEGIISKRAEGTYRSGRSKDWLKIKCTHRQEFVIGGFTRPEGARSHFGALHVGVMAKGGLVYAGKVGTGFSGKTLASIHAKLTKLTVDEPPFVDPPRGAEAARSQWVRPELVCEIEFTERTKDGKIRHPTFRGLRSDKSAEEVVLEVEQPAPKAKAKRRTKR